MRGPDALTSPHSAGASRSPALALHRRQGAAGSEEACPAASVSPAAGSGRTPLTQPRPGRRAPSAHAGPAHLTATRTELSSAEPHMPAASSGRAPGLRRRRCRGARAAAGWAAGGGRLTSAALQPCWATEWRGGGGAQAAVHGPPAPAPSAPSPPGAGAGPALQRERGERWPGLPAAAAALPAGLGLPAAARRTPARGARSLGHSRRRPRPPHAARGGRRVRLPGRRPSRPRGRALCAAVREGAAGARPGACVLAQPQPDSLAPGAAALSPPLASSWAPGPGL